MNSNNPGHSRRSRSQVHNRATPRSSPRRNTCRRRNRYGRSRNPDRSSSPPVADKPPRQETASALDAWRVSEWRCRRCARWIEWPLKKERAAQAALSFHSAFTLTRRHRAPMAWRTRAIRCLERHRACRRHGAHPSASWTAAGRARALHQARPGCAPRLLPDSAAASAPRWMPASQRPASGAEPSSASAA